MPTPTIWCGIDPGLSGAIALIGNGSLVAACPFRLIDGPGHLTRELDTAWLAEVLEEYNPRIVMLELVQGFKGASASFKFGQSYGSIITTTLAARFRLERVRPQAWQKAILGEDIEDTKKASIAFAEANWPGVCRINRKLNHNVSDSLCLAEFARRTYGDS